MPGEYRSQTNKGDMMPNLGKTSRRRLSTCHPLIQRTAHRVIEIYDYTVLELGGWRGREIQDKLFAGGQSKVQWPNSKHNHIATAGDVADGFARRVGDPLSYAIDVAPWYLDRPHIRWRRMTEFVFLSGLWIGIADTIMQEHGFKLRSGTNWDMDEYILTDQRFDDGPHLEMVRI